MPIVLQNQSETGMPIRIEFLPEKGMNMVSLNWGGIEVIDQSTRPKFEERCGGLGPIIGPHFHRRNPAIIPTVEGFSKNGEGPDPFSHGIGRYASWKYTSTETSFDATLSGKDVLNGVPLSKLEGQDFKMRFQGNLTSTSLKLELSVVSEADSLVGIHYYYALPEGKGTILSQVQNAYITNNEKKSLPKEWTIDARKWMTYPLDQETDFTFFPYPDPVSGTIILETATHSLITGFHSPSQECSWQLWHPKGASFVCIEPVSAQDPRHPNLTVSSINIELQVVPNFRRTAAP